METLWTMFATVCFIPVWLAATVPAKTLIVMFGWACLFPTLAMWLNLRRTA